MAGLLARSLAASRKIKGLLVIVAVLYIISFIFGWLIISMQLPFATEFRKRILETVGTQWPFTSLFELMKSGNLILAILLTFAVNLTNGAFMSTTLPGVVPLLGALGIVAVTVYRGVMIGLTYPEVMSLSSETFLVAIGTMILELGAYVFAGAAGINIALSSVFPRRYQVDSRWKAFKESCKDAAEIYVIVIILLVLGAIWEITGLFLLIYSI